MFRRPRSRSGCARSQGSFFSFLGKKSRCSAERALAYKSGFSRRLFVESLEDRRMLAVTWNLIPIAAGTVVGNGADTIPGNADDEVTVALPANVMEAFREATRIFDQFLTDNVTINLEVGWGVNFAALTNAFASTFLVPDTYTNVRNALQADQTSTDDSTAFSNLVPAPDFDVFINHTNNNPNGAGSATPYLDNDGDANNTTLAIPRANAKALGLLNPSDAGLDGRIVFNSTRPWDLNRVDGISSNSFDFSGIAAHEIGHFLGFSSGVDFLDIDNQANGRPGRNDDGFTVVSVLDLFRFSAESIAAGGAGTIDFTADARTKFFSIDGGATQLGELGQGVNNGNPANQASHWLELVPEIGMMDPTTDVGELDFLTPLDLVALDVIGWNINTDALSPTPTIQGTPGDDTFVVSLNPSDTSRVQVQLNGALVASYGVNDIDLLTIEGLGGNDTLIVDSSNGLIGLARAIVFDGGSGQDTLNLRQTGGAERTSETLTVGATPGSGIDTIVSGGITQVVRFDNLEPIITNVPVTTFVIDGALIGSFLNGANQITYNSSDLFGASWGRITIDAFEPVHFINKENVIVDAGGGDDTIVADNASVPTALETITFNGDAGNDIIRLEALPATGAATFVRAIVNVQGDVTRPQSGDGHDVIDASLITSNTQLTLNGGAGNDTIIGGAGNDTISGGTGDDTFIDSRGTDSYDGGSGDDALVIRGTNAANLIDVFQNPLVGGNYPLAIINSPIAGPFTSTTNTIVGAAGLPTVELIRIEALGGDDVVRVGHADAYIAGGIEEQTIAFYVDGGSPNVNDRLIVRDEGLGDLIIQRLGGTGSGSFVVGATASIDYIGVEYASVASLDPITGGTGTDGAGRLVVFKQDPYESNDALANAWFLGAGVTVNADPTIDPGGINIPGVFEVPGDADFFRFVAQENGVLDFQIYFRPVGTLTNGRAGLPGDGELTVTVFDSDGNPLTGIGTGTNLLDPTGVKIGERIAIPVVRNQTYFLRVTGQTAEAINVYNFTAINVTAPIPQLVDLQAASDSGRHNSDNITRIATATFDIILDDDRIEEFTNQELIRDNVDNDARDNDYGVEVFNNGVSIGFAFYTGTGNTWRFTAGAGDLVEGSNNFISAAVWIRDAANPAQFSRHELSTPLQVTIDTTAPPVSFGLPGGTDGLAGASDTGVATEPATFADRVTSDTTPTLWGRAEANSIVRVFLDLNNNGIIDLATDVFLAQTVAVPFDGNVAYPNGYWEVTSSLDLNAITGLGRDGLRRLLVTAEDVAGNPVPNGANQITTGVDLLQIFLDTQGPQITNVQIPGFPGFNLFDPKPTTNGFTPLINSLSIAVRDLPNRSNADPNFLYQALIENIAENPGNYALVGDHVGNIAIQSIVWTPVAAVNGAPATGTITLNFAAPLPDDRYTLVILDALVDPAGNKLDGETNAVQPLAIPNFPTGDGVPGGNFVARFTVDSRPEIGTFISQNIAIDINGNSVWDPANGQTGGDATNVDLTFTMDAFENGSAIAGNQSPHDLLVAGRFTAIGTNTPGARFFDQLATYGNYDGVWRWLIDLDSDGVVYGNGDPDGVNDLIVNQAPIAGFNIAAAIPIAGNFDNNSANGDEIGLYYAGKWALDTNHDYIIDTVLTGNLLGTPIVGDFDGNGTDDFAVFNNNVFSFGFNLSPNSATSLVWGFPGVLDKPVAADMDQDGIDDIGLWVPRNSAATPSLKSEWYFLISNDPLGTRRIANSVNTLNHPFTPVPFGADRYAEFGDDYAMPIVGNFDPPVAVSMVDPHQFNGGDFNGDGAVTGRDFLAWQRDTSVGSLANWQNSFGPPLVTSVGGDFNSDGAVTGRDFLAWQRGGSPASFTQSDLAQWQDGYGTAGLSAVAAALTVEEEEAAGSDVFSLGGFLVETEAESIASLLVDDLYVEEVDRALEELADVPVQSMNGFGEMVARRNVKRVSAE